MHWQTCHTIYALCATVVEFGHRCNLALASNTLYYTIDKQTCHYKEKFNIVLGNLGKGASEVKIGRDSRRFLASPRMRVKLGLKKRTAVLGIQIQENPNQHSTA